VKLASALIVAIIMADADVQWCTCKSLIANGYWAQCTTNE